MMWFRQIAQLSTTISQAHKATAFHFLTSKRFLPSALPSDPPALALPTVFFAGTDDPEGASVISTSAMVICCCECREKSGEGADGGVVPGSRRSLGWDRGQLSEGSLRIGWFWMAEEDGIRSFVGVRKRGLSKSSAKH